MYEKNAKKRKINKKKQIFIKKILNNAKNNKK